MVKNYLSYDTKQLIAETKNSFDKQNNVPGSSNAGDAFQKQRLQTQQMNELDKLDDQQKKMVLKTPRMRSIENKDEKERLYQDDLIDAYLKRYVILTK